MKGAGRGAEAIGADIAGSAEVSPVEEDTGIADRNDDSASGFASVTVVAGNDDESSRNSERVILSSEAGIE